MWNTFLMFDWDSQTWTQMPDMPTGRDNHRCEIIETENGKELWVMGGYRDGEYFDDVEIFKFNSMQWSTGVRLPGPRDGHSTAVVENNIIVIGGQNSMNALDSILKWNPELNDWEYLELGLDGPRSFFGATLVDERSGVTCS